MECKQLANDIAGDKWTLVALKSISTDECRTWSNSDGLVYNWDSYLGLYKCVNFKE